MSMFILFFILIFFTCYFSLRIFIYLSYKLKFNIDNKNPNYSLNPTPTSSGIVLFFLFIFFLYLAIYLKVPNYFELFDQKIPNNFWVLLVSLTILVLLSFIDDLKSIDPIIRIFFQGFLIFFSTTTLNTTEIDLPYKLILFLVIITWIYITNIINFLDGSDGFLGIIMFFFWMNIFLINYFFDISTFSSILSLIIIPIILSFLILNYSPAKIFMGDSGSIFFGILTGFAFLEIIIQGYYLLGLALISYPLVDCSITIIKKLKKGYMPWVGLYDYFYLIPPLRSKKNHKKVFFVILILNIINSSIIFFSLSFNIKATLLITYIFSLIVILIFKNVKIENYI